MKLPHEFIQLPVCFDANRLAQEVAKLEALWVPHHEGFKGNFSIPLISVNGQSNNEFKGPMACTSTLHESPYLKQTIASFGEVIGRSRLMGLAPGCEVPLHSDINYHWYKRVRIHIPIVTDPNVIFHCGDRNVHMQAGEAWIFDSWKYHRVCNDSDVFRVHLVIDISGSSRFWDWTEQGMVPWLNESVSDTPVNEVMFSSEKSVNVETEQFNVPLVMTPGEMEGLAGDLCRDVQSCSNNSANESAELCKKVSAFCRDWRDLWGRYGMTEAGWPHYHQLRQKAFEGVRHLDKKVMLENGTEAVRMFLFCMIDPALNVEVKDQYLPGTRATPEAPVRIKGQQNGVQPTTSKPTQQPGNPTPSRNAPCPCGSGKKYKECHGQIG